MGINNARFDLAYVFGVPIPQRSRGKLPFNSPKLARTNVDINRSSLYGMVRYPRRGLDERILINR